MHKNVPAEKARAPAVHGRAVLARIPPNPKREQDDSGGDHEPEAEIHEHRRPAGRSRPSISEVIVKASAGLWTSVARKTPRPALPSPARTSKSAATLLASATPPTSEWTASPMAAEPHGRAFCALRPDGATLDDRLSCADRAHGSARRGHGLRRRTRCAPSGASLRLVVVKREESFEEEQCQETDRRPGNRRGRSHPHGFGHHVKKSGAEHRAGRKAQVDLQTRVVEYGRQRQNTAQDADRHDGQAERAQRDRHVACLASEAADRLTRHRGTAHKPTLPSTGCLGQRSVANDPCGESASDEIMNVDVRASGPSFERTSSLTDAAGSESKQAH